MAKLQGVLPFPPANFCIFSLEWEGNGGGGTYSTNTALNSPETCTRQTLGWGHKCFKVRMRQQNQEKKQLLKMKRMSSRN